MSDEAAVIVAKDMEVVLVVVYASEQLECFLPQWWMTIDSNQFVKIKMIYDNLVREICYPGATCYHQLWHHVIQI